MAGLGQSCPALGRQVSGDGSSAGPLIPLDIPAEMVTFLGRVRDSESARML